MSDLRARHPGPTSSTSRCSSRLALTDDEIEQLTGELEAILDYAAEVSALDTADVPPTAHPLPLVNVFRPDDPRPGLDRDEVLAQAPAAEDGQFRVPRILGEAGE